MGNLLGFCQAHWTWKTAWFEIQGRAASDLLPWARILFIATVGASSSASAWRAAKCGGITLPQLARILLLPLLAFVVFNTVFSPQYMIWLASIAGVAILSTRPWSATSVFLATIATSIFFPASDYSIGLNGCETGVLICRNLLLLAAWVVLFLEMILEIAPDQCESKVK